MNYKNYKITEVSVVFADDKHGNAYRNAMEKLTEQFDLGLKLYSFPGEAIEISPDITLWNVACFESVDYERSKITIRYMAYDAHEDGGSYLGMTEEEIAIAEALINEELRSLGATPQSFYEEQWGLWRPSARYKYHFLDAQKDDSSEDKVRNLLGL